MMAFEYAVNRNDLESNSLSLKIIEYDQVTRCNLDKTRYQMGGKHTHVGSNHRSSEP